MEAWRVRAAEWSSCSVQSGLTLRTSVPSGMLDAHANGSGRDPWDGRSRRSRRSPALHGHPAPPSASSAPHRRRVLKFDLLWGDITL